MPRNPKLPSLEGLLSDEERDAIVSARATAPFHPLAVLLRGESPSTELIAANTERAVRQVKRRDEEWLHALKKRVLQIEPLTEPASALAELRTYGYLLEAGFAVSPIPANAPGSKPDFVVRLNGEEMHVEVQAKQIETTMAEELRTFHDAATNENARASASESKPKITVREKVVQPFGRSRPDHPEDTTATNAISKISQIKDRDHQFGQGIPGLLWLDFQDAQNLSMALSPEHLSPVMSWRGLVHSGVLWYALYGWKNAPVFERYCLFSPFRGKTITPMEHEGRFRRSQKVSAVLFSFPNASLLAC